MTTPLDRLAQRVTSDPGFLAAALAAYGKSEGLDDAALAARLGCDPPILTNLRLCRMPRPQPPQFGQDVERIAGRFGVQAEVLADMVRRGQNLLRFQAGATPGTLLAARDRPKGESS
jgi:hypothetical protein